MDVDYFQNTLGLCAASADTTCGSNVVYYHKNLSSATHDPIIVLIHGYPQSSYMWRHIVPLLPDSTALFIPDIPGYGRSTPSLTGHDKSTIGTAILEALHSHLSPIPHTLDVILIGHDRGARIIYRVSVDNAHPDLRIVGSVMIDIMPTLHQFTTFSDPVSSTGAFHWTFLANVTLSVPMIMAYGGPKFCESLLDRWSHHAPDEGSEETGDEARGIARSDGAWGVYAGYFNNESVVRATCLDYEAGATIDVQRQREDQACGRKIPCDVLVIYSSQYLGKKGDVGSVWKEWVEEGRLIVAGVDGVGHFIPEENPGVVADLISKFVERVTCAR